MDGFDSIFFEIQEKWIHHCPWTFHEVVLGRLEKSDQGWRWVDVQDPSVSILLPTSKDKREALVLRLESLCRQQEAMVVEQRKDNYYRLERRLPMFYAEPVFDLLVRFLKAHASLFHRKAFFQATGSGRHIPVRQFRFSNAIGSHLVFNNESEGFFVSSSSEDPSLRWLIARCNVHLQNLYRSSYGIKKEPEIA